ncbi:MAG: TolC family protein [Treponema sp.]|jgi:outer membrane protein TolC|nr:TolC family protein [Treponema sp.]
MYKKLKFYLPTVVMLLFCIENSFSEQQADDVKSSTSQNFTVEQAVELAIENNISLKQSRISVTTVKREKDHSWNSISPSISVSAGASSPNDRTDYGSDYSSYVKAGVSFSFSPSLFTTMKSATLDYESGLISYDAAARSVELSVRSSFYGLLYEKENIVLQQRNLETAKAQYETNLSKYKQGSVSQLDVLSSQVSYEELKPTLESAEVTWQNDMASFKQLLGIPQPDEITLNGSLEKAAAINQLSSDGIVSQSLSVKAAEKNLEIAKNDLAASRMSAFGPSVSLAWTYEPTVTDGSSSSTDEGDLSVSVSIPLGGYLPWSSESDTVAGSKDNVKSLELELENEKTTVKIETESYLRQINQARSSVKSLQANVELARKSYDMTEEAYNHGKTDLLSLQDASDSLLSAQVSLQSELYTLITAILDLENVTGVPFGTLGK